MRLSKSKYVHYLLQNLMWTIQGIVVDKLLSYNNNCRSSAADRNIASIKVNGLSRLVFHNAGSSNTHWDFHSSSLWEELRHKKVIWVIKCFNTSRAIVSWETKSNKRTWGDQSLFKSQQQPESKLNISEEIKRARDQRNG